MRVISGGQIGVDIAALRAAKAAGLETGGWIPLGFLTQRGLRPEYAELYGMREIGGREYPTRTYANVSEADATIRIAYRWLSPGEKCTLSAIVKYQKPHLDIDPRNPLRPEVVAHWLQTLGVETLNVAGNADEELEPFVEGYLTEVFKCLNTEPQ